MNRGLRLINVTQCVLFLIIFVLLGCTPTYKVGDFDISSTVSRKIPLRIGLLLRQGFRNPTMPPLLFDNTQLAKVRLEEAMTNGAEKAYNEAFKEVLIIDSVERDNINRIGIQLIASPEILRAELAENWFFFSKYQITCKWTISRPDGKPVYMNTVMGEGIDRSFLADTRYWKSVTLAVKDHYKKLLSHLLSVNWWENVK